MAIAIPALLSSGRGTRGWYERLESERLRRCEHEMRERPERKGYHRYRRETSGAR